MSPTSLTTGWSGTRKPTTERRVQTRLTCMHSLSGVQYARACDRHRSAGHRADDCADQGGATDQAGAAGPPDQNRLLLCASSSKEGIDVSFLRSQETVYKAPESGAQEKEDKKPRRKKDATTPRGRGAAKGSEASRPTTRQESEDDDDGTSCSTSVQQNACKYCYAQKTVALSLRLIDVNVAGSAVGIFQRVGVTFTPVYKCIHIYENLSSLTEFENYYQYTRQVRTYPATPKRCRITYSSLHLVWCVCVCSLAASALGAAGPRRAGLPGEQASLRVLLLPDHGLLHRRSTRMAHHPEPHLALHGTRTQPELNLSSARSL